MPQNNVDHNKLTRYPFGFTAVSTPGNERELSDGWSHALLSPTGEVLGAFDIYADLIREAKRLDALKPKPAEDDDEAPSTAAEPAPGPEASEAPRKRGKAASK